MKKTILILILAAVMLFCGCSGRSSAPAATAAPTQAPTAAPTEAPAATEAPVVTEAPAPATEAPEPDANAAEEAKALVLSMKDQPVEDLIARLGEPLDRAYSSSCLVQGGQDGVLTYDGFTVYTLVQPDGTETVYDVE